MMEKGKKKLRKKNIDKKKELREQGMRKKNRLGVSREEIMRESIWKM